MNDLRAPFAVLLLAMLGGCTSHVTHEFPTREGLEQSGTFTVRTEHMLRIATGGRGDGHLLFQGWEHPFVFEGAKVIVVGDHAKELEGAVYNLERIEDFAGTYEPVGAEFGAGEGLTGAWGKNGKGVVVYVRFHNQDIEINKEAGGLKVTLQ